MEIAIWGDSITYGECDNEGLGWVGRLRKSFPISDYVGVYNRGICGDTTEDLLVRFKVEAESLKPDKIIFAIGINDTKYPSEKTTSNVLLDNSKSNIRLILGQAKTFTKKIFIVGMTKVDEKAKRYTGTKFINKDIQVLNDFFKEIAEEQQLTFIDVFNLLDINNDLYDGLHPNSNGYEKLYKTIATFLK